VTQV